MIVQRRGRRPLRRSRTAVGKRRAASERRRSLSDQGQVCRPHGAERRDERTAEPEPLAADAIGPPSVVWDGLPLGVMKRADDYALCGLSAERGTGAPGGSASGGPGPRSVPRTAPRTLYRAGGARRGPSEDPCSHCTVHA